jgi:hypothetical protein
VADTPEGDAAAAGGAAPPVVGGDNRRETAGEPPVNSTVDVTRARDARGRFVAGASGSPGTRFRRGRSGNPAGRPKGSFRAGMRVAARLLDDEAEALAHKAIEMALDGDPVAVRFCLGRILGNRCGQPVELDLPAIAAPADLGPAVGAVAAAVGEGRLTPEEAMHLAQMLDGFPRILAASLAGRPPEDGSAEDPRQVLLDELNRIAAAGTVAPPDC